MKHGRRERELRALLRVPEQGCYNLADFVGAHGAELGLDLTDTNQPDEALAPRLRAHLERRRQEQRAHDDTAARSIVGALAVGARWRGGQVILPSRPFFRVASPSVGKRYIRIVGDAVDVTVSRDLVQRAGAALRLVHDVTVNVDADGVHIRWSARGGLNLYPQRVNQSADVLVVALPSPGVVRTMPVLVGEILSELGYGT